MTALRKRFADWLLPSFRAPTMVCGGVSGAVGGFIAPVPLTPRTQPFEPSNYVLPCESHVTCGQFFRQLMQNLDISIVYIDSVISKQFIF